MIRMIDSEYVMKAEEIYEWKDRFYLCLEYMDGKDLSRIITDYHEHYSEEFIKYSIWCAAKGLDAMHDFGILHRDIKSDNFVCKSTGEIKLADLGLSVCLTKD